VDGPFGFRTVNARAQEDDPGSLLSLARALARVRREQHAAAAGWTTVDVGDPAVLALRRDGLLTLHNLSGREAAVDVGAGHDALLADGWAAGRLAPYGFAWLRTA
jgi:maltose alpha-D-glucosyltransferase/alpha-amylase